MAHTKQIKSIIRYWADDVPQGYGDDAGGGDTVGLLYYVQLHYGSVASFTGSYRADRWDVEINGTEINEIPAAFATPNSGRILTTGFDGMGWVSSNNCNPVQQQLCLQSGILHLPNL